MLNIALGSTSQCHNLEVGEKLTVFSGSVHCVAVGQLSEPQKHCQDCPMLLLKVPLETVRATHTISVCEKVHYGPSSMILQQQTNISPT